MLWRVLDKAIGWFVWVGGVYEPLEPGRDGVQRSQVFPGLWLDAKALLAGDMAAVQAVLTQGLASPEHDAFKRTLAARR